MWTLQSFHCKHTADILARVQIINNWNCSFSHTLRVKSWWEDLRKYHRCHSWRLPRHQGDTEIIHLIGANICIVEEMCRWSHWSRLSCTLSPVVMITARGFSVPESVEVWLDLQHTFTGTHQRRLLAVLLIMELLLVPGSTASIVQ